MAASEEQIRSACHPAHWSLGFAVGMANLPSQVVHELLSVSGFGDGAFDGAVYFRSREVLEAGFQLFPGIDAERGGLRMVIGVHVIERPEADQELLLFAFWTVPPTSNKIHGACAFRGRSASTHVRVAAAEWQAIVSTAG